MVAEYRCECGYKWKMKNTSGGSKLCKMCYEDVQPYKYRPATEKVRTLHGTVVLLSVNTSSKTLVYI